MKKINKFFLMGTVALTGMAGVTSCSSDNEPSDNDQPGVAGQVVKTQFALNVPYANGTRMTESVTQVDKTFRGIENMRLFTYKAEPAVGVNADSRIVLGSNTNAYASQQAKMVYRDIAIPVETEYFTLYGTATVSGSNNSPFKYGSISSSSEFRGNDNTTSKFTFNLNPIKRSADFSTDEEAQKVIEVLNSVIGTKYRGLVGKTEQDVYWTDLADLEDSQMTSAERFAKNLYDRFIKLKAGSAASVKAALSGLQAQTGEEPSENSLLGKIAMNCRDGIKKLSDESVSFPRNISLPDGIARLTYDVDRKEFAYDIKKSVEIGDNSIDYTKITYPASLNYFISTKSMVSDKALIELNDLPDYADWTNKNNVNNAWSSKGFVEGPVQNSTRSIGLKDAVQYAVANMKLSVKCKDAVLKDNANEQGGEKVTEDQDIDVPASGYTVTGILVGGQPSQVGWDYLPNLTEEAFDYTVYDKDMNGEMKAKANEKSVYNYTLLLDNKALLGDQKQVYVTIELTNDGKDFYGKDGIVPAGGTFYLLGKLDMDNLGTSGNKPENVDHIFVKDYTTTVDLTIASLKNAYNCIPDLRSSLLSLGLAVDLTWQEGITFDVTIE